MGDKVLYPRNKYSASTMSKPWTSLLRTHGSRSHGHCQRPQQTRWEFRRWDGALPLKAAGAPAEPQTQHTQYGISEMRFETPGPLGATPGPRENAVQPSGSDRRWGLLGGWKEGVDLEILNGFSSNLVK